jgi:biopolymer transport protein ExbD
MERLRNSNRQSYPEEEGDEIDIIPLVDVIFLLLTFFIFITLSMVVQEGVNVSLASSETGQSVKDREPIVVSVKESGQIYFNKNQVSAKELLSRLKRRASRNKKQPVFLNADQAAQHKNVIEALDTVRKSGLSNVTFTVKPNR